MRAYLFFLICIVPNLFFGQEQEYDLYVEYRYVGGASPFNSNVYLNINSALVFNEYMQAPASPPTVFTQGGILSSNTSKNNLSWNSSINSIRNAGNVTLGLTGQASFMLDDAGRTWSCRIWLLDKILLNAPSMDSQCYKDKITLEASAGHPAQAYTWYYSASGHPEQELQGTFSSQNVSLMDLYPNPDDYIDLIDKPIRFRLYNELNDYSVYTTYTWKDCSPELIDVDPISTKNTSCYTENDGSVTLTFKEDIATGSQMRFFVYEGEIPANVSEANLKTDIPQFPGITKQVIADPLMTLTPTPNGFNGTVEGLSGNSSNLDGTGNDFSDYFIIYQEVDYSISPPKVKSGSIIPATFRIHQPSQVILDTSGPNFFRDAACGNPATFQLENTASGGNNLIPNGDYSYEYSLNGGSNWSTLASSPPILEIAPAKEQQVVQIRGTYTVGDISCSGAVYEYIISPEEPPLQFTDPAGGTTSTPEASDGEVRVHIVGGKSPLAYSLTRLDPLANNFEPTPATAVPSFTPEGYLVSFVNLATGTYRIQVVDGSGCTQETSDLIVAAGHLPELGVFTATPIGCDGSPGSISVPVMGADPSYRYQWIINGTEGSIENSGKSTIVLNNIIAAGDYTLRVSNSRTSDEDFERESNIVQVMVNIAEDDPVTITNVVPKSVSCSTATDGSIFVEVSGGDSYEYTLELFPDPEDWYPLEENTISNLASDFYRITIRNGKGCESNTLHNILVGAPVPWSLSYETTGAGSHGGAEGSIVLTVVGGTPDLGSDIPYTILWEKEDSVFIDAESSSLFTIDGLTAGSYWATITDSNGCQVRSEEIVITQPDSLAVTHFSGTDACFGLSNGTLMVKAEGTGIITYTWSLQDGTPNGTVVDALSTSDRTITIEGMPPGSYSLQIRDENGNESISGHSVEIKASSPITATITPVAANCSDLSTGAIVIRDVSGGNPSSIASGYEYRIDNLSDGFQLEPEFTNLLAGTYVVIIRDSKGCEYEEMVKVEEALPPRLDLQNSFLTKVSMPGGSDGAITLAFLGDTTGYKYSWMGPNVDGDTRKDLSRLSVGTYQVTITTPMNCTLVEDFIVNGSNDFAATLVQTVELECSGDDFAEITAHLQGGVAPFTYKWFQIVDTNKIPIIENSPVLPDLGVGTYFIEVIDNEGNTADSTPISIKSPDPLVIVADQVVEVNCGNEATGAIRVSVSGGTGPYLYTWSNGVITEDLVNVRPGEYTLEVMDANACFSEITVNIPNTPNTVQITEAVVGDVSEYNARDGSISLAISGGTTPYDIHWTRLSDGEVIGSQASISYLEADAYQVFVSDANGCTVVETFQVGQPDIVEEIIGHPTCNGEADGNISLLVNQGNGEFDFQWSHGATGPTLTNLKAASYTVVITGFADGPISRTYILEEPVSLQVDLPEQAIICAGQELYLNARVADETATYRWASSTGFSSNDPEIVVRTGGNYTVAITTATGCNITTSVEVRGSDSEIDAEFAMASQVFVGESLVAVDISFPFPETLEWVVPEGAQVLKMDGDEAELVFNTAGEYEVGIITKIGECTAQRTKKVLVIDRDGSIPLTNEKENVTKIGDDFIIYPNPTSGKFTAEVVLSERGNISIKVFSFANNALMAQEKARGESSYSIPFDISGLPSGVYAVVLETPFGNALRKIILN